MAEAATGSERRFDATVYSPAISGDNSHSDRAQFGALRPIESGADLNPELPALLKLGTLKQEMGSFAEAEELFRKALELGDRMFGPDHQEMIILLNDLTRLYLKQGSYASAEPLLLRLLDLKKSKGEDHPEVATVLASLASVRQALGRHESAEQLWRHVVDIRERTLAPNHFATATALENLGQSCAARGKNRAALAAFERALVIRERTLGPEHPSVRTARERIADLQLQGSDDSGYADDEVDPFPIPQERFRLSPGERSIAAPTPLPTRQRADREAMDVDRTPVLAMPRAGTNERKPENRQTEESAAESNENEPLRLAPVAAYRDALESVMRDLEEPSETPTFWERKQNSLTALVGLLRGRQAAGTIAISAIGLLVLGSAAMSGAMGEGERGKEVASPEASQTTPSISLPAVRTERNPVAALNSVASIPAAAVSKQLSTAPRDADTRTAPHKAAEKTAPPSISIPKISSSVLSGVEAVASKAGSAPSHGIESFSLQPAATPQVNRASMFSDNQVEAPQHARLIGELPKPTVPSQLVNVEGDVRLRFTVDTNGRPVMSSVVVVSSTHQALTDAVKRVIPSMRFEPANTGGPDPKAVTEVVQLGFVFSSHAQ
jgi:TonB family protein